MSCPSQKEGLDVQCYITDGTHNPRRVERTPEAGERDLEDWVPFSSLYVQPWKLAPTSPSLALACWLRALSCSFRRPRFSSQHTHVGSELPPTPVSKGSSALVWPLQALHAYLHTHKLNTHTHKKITFLKNIFRNLFFKTFYSLGKTFSIAFSNTV